MLFGVSGEEKDKSILSTRTGMVTKSRTANHHLKSLV